MYKWLIAGCLIGFGIGLLASSILFEAWLSTFGNPITIDYMMWDWSQQVSIWKYTGWVWLLTGAIGTYALYKVSKKTKPLPKSSKNTQKINMRIAEEPTHDEPSKAIVTPASKEDLLKITNTIEKPIAHQKLPSKTVEKESQISYVSGGSMQCQFVETQPTETSPSIPTTIPSTNSPAAYSQRKHLTKKHSYLLTLSSMSFCIIFIAICFAVILPTLEPTIPSQARAIALLILAITAIIGFMTIIFRRMKRK